MSYVQHPFGYPPERPVHEPVNEMIEATAKLREMVALWHGREPTCGQMADVDLMLAGMARLVVEIRQRTWG